MWDAADEVGAGWFPVRAPEPGELEQERLHSALDYIPPTEFERDFGQGQAGGLHLRPPASQEGKSRW
ncbi:hypothetical protein GCM10010502_63550 [Kitasatospora aureofaciens]|uniref:Uncharacterized protein n=1 Tax=Kitasatospora aureofaciens TaxID=1894 RepID=A0A8H9I0E8_KITAU|nr:hypothetical protein GCM10010502_63550 [Kitasatospora aureofaciens]